MNFKADSQLKDFIKVFKNVIPEQSCKYIIENADSLNWETHRWSDYNKIISSITPDHESQRAAANRKMLLLLNPMINDCIENYVNDTKYFKIKGISGVNINKYDATTLMNPHVDHIHSVFDGSIKGIPTLSVVGLFNNNYEGGKFMFWGDHEADINAGSIMIFPSNFLYSHEVKPITSGTRFSFVTWVY